MSTICVYLRGWNTTLLINGFLIITCSIGIFFVYEKRVMHVHTYINVIEKSITSAKTVQTFLRRLYKWPSFGVGEVSSEQWSSEQCTAVLLTVISSEQWTAVLLAVVSSEQWTAVLLAVVSSEQWTAVLLAVVSSEQWTAGSGQQWAVDCCTAGSGKQWAVKQ